MPADFRVEGVSRVPLYASPSADGRVAVAPGGAWLRGELNVVGGECWLCIDLAEDHPLRVPGERESCWVQAGEFCRPPPLAWAGVKCARAVGAMLDLQWERPFAHTGDVDYCVWMQPGAGAREHGDGGCSGDGEDGGPWDIVWRGQLGEDFGSQRVEVTVEWPYPVGAARLVIDAAADHLRLTSAATAVRCSAEHVPAGAKAGPPAVPAVVTTTAGGRIPQVGTAGVETRPEMLGRAAAYEPRSLPQLLTRGVALRQPPAHAAGPPVGPFRRALVMGLYHSCTTAMALELQQRFGIPVTNKLVTSRHDALWKHRVHRADFAAAGDGGTLTVLMVKEPRFWLQSVARNFYELHPVARDAQGCLRDVPSRSFASLFGPVEHDQVIYPDAVALWSDAMCSYLDDAVYPASASVIVRAEDFLFRFDAVMDELAATWPLGLPGRGVPRAQPRQRPTKSGARSRAEALAYYSDPANRTRGFEEEHLRRVSDAIDPRIAELLGYGEDAVAAWAAASTP